MTVKKIVSTFAIFCLISSFVFAEKVKITLGDGSIYEADLPDDIANLVKENKTQIEEALKDNNISSADLDNAVQEIKDIYNDMDTGYSPLSDLKTGLSNFSEDLGASIANAQLMQNVWAEAWIGKLVPGLHMGFGINVGAGQLNLEAFKKTMKALDIGDLDDFPDFLAFPTVAADLRLGGIKLPFDIGFSILTLDSAKMKKLNNAISPTEFKYLTLGIDMRWAISQGKGRAPRFSAGAGWALTKGSVNIESDYADAGLSFKTMNFYAQAQISKKLLFFIPFAGLKLSYVRSNLSWNATAQWNDIFSGNDEEIAKLQKWNILPTTFEDSYDSSNFVPQIFAGFGLDIFVVNLTFVGGWDLKNKLFSGAFNFRIAW